MTTEVIVGVISGVVAAILSDDILAWSPRLAERLVRFAAKKTPPHLRERCQQEWLADLSEIPGRFSKLLWAVGTIGAAININRDRLFEIGLSAFLLTLFLPVMLVIGVLIKIDSPGPVFSRQKRHGFTVLKFRSMYVNDTDNACNPRVTQVGAFLRRKSLDKLPQLISVLKGDMRLKTYWPPKRGQ